MKTYDIEFFRQAGRKGGIATAKKYSQKTRRKWGRLGGQNNKKPKNPKTLVDNYTETAKNASV